jgi:hypothetical protein
MNTRYSSFDKYTSKVMQEIHKGVSDSGLKLLQLVEQIPNWESYLTPKQREVVEKYIKCLNACEVDYQLNLNMGTTQQRLFGSSTSKGALGRLEEIGKHFKQTGYFDRKEVQAKPQKTKSISDKTKEEITELIKLIVEIPDYENYLTTSQKDKLYQFLRLRSLSACAKYFNITENAFQQTLLGRNGKGGILGKLKQYSAKNTVNSWEEL